MYTLARADEIASEVTAALSPFCHRCEVAGSTRRRKSSGDIKDLEVVIFPKPELSRELAAIINAKWGTPSIGKWPSKYAQIRARYNLDIFTCVNPDAWGLLLTIRTGPAQFSERLLSFWKTVTKGGYSEECILHLADGTPVPCREERDVFDALAHYSGKPCPFLPPEKRLENKPRK